MSANRQANAHRSGINSSRAVSSSASSATRRDASSFPAQHSAAALITWDFTMWRAEPNANSESLAYSDARSFADPNANAESLADSDT